MLRSIAIVDDDLIDTIDNYLIIIKLLLLLFVKNEVYNVICIS
jgi:hypothetical protein